MATFESSLKLLLNEAELSLAFVNLFQDSSALFTELHYRRNVVLSQSLTTCVCGVVTAIISSVDKPDVLNQYAQCGILYQVESLLSTRGNELGMLQDYAVGTFDLRNVDVKCEKADQKQEIPLLPTLYGTPDKLTVVLHFDDATFEKLPRSLQAGRFMKIIPLIFSVGINEEQSLAEKFGDTSLQEYLNRESLQRMNEYYTQVKEKYPQAVIQGHLTAEETTSASTADQQNSSETSQDSSNSDFQEISLETQEDMISWKLDKLRKCIHTKKNKNVEILQQAANICRVLHGVRTTSCKSAKDRTGMSVTLEQVNILKEKHQLKVTCYDQTLACMRANGVRMDNVLKNVGARKYAFTPFQLMTFPRQYKPPEGTYGKIES